MARFTFRLQSVLEHKQRLEELAQQEHARAQAAQVREEHHLARLIEAEHTAVDELERQRFTGRLNIEALQLGMSYLDTLKVQLLRQEQVVTRVQAHTEAQREQLVERMQERKALERLREKQLAAFVAEENRRETAAADDLVVMRHARQMIESRREAAHAG